MRESLRRLASDERMSRPRAPGCRPVRVELLDGTTVDIQLERKSKGGVLLDKVCEHIDLLDKDYFGLLHAERGDPRVWVDLNKRLSKTFKNEPWEVRLAVKFFPQEPAEIQDEVTRDQLMYAVRRDLMEGRLSCSFITYALLGSLVLQVELGDADTRVSGSDLLRLRAAPASVLNEDLEDKMFELHALHKGQNPAEAVLNYLENAKKLSQYGAELHCARDCDEADILLGVCAAGVAVYREGLLMNKFPWAKLTKICYKKRLFTLKLRPSEFDECELSISFKLPSTKACCKLWKCSVEHHMFFRREEPVQVNRVSGIPALGSRRLSCRRTLRQIRDEPYKQEITA